MQFDDFITELPLFKSKSIELVDRLAYKVEDVFNIPYDKFLICCRQMLMNIYHLPDPMFGNAIIASSGIITFIGLVPIFIFFFLLYRSKFKGFILEVVPKDSQVQTLEIFMSIKRVARDYISGLAIVIIILGTLASVGLFAIGIKYALFFGVLSALLSVVPLYRRFYRSNFTDSCSTIN